MVPDHISHNLAEKESSDYQIQEILHLDYKRTCLEVSFLISTLAETKNKESIEFHSDQWMIIDYR